jgi:Immunity protein 27
LNNLTIKKSETSIVGNVIIENTKVKFDEQSLRIEKLINGHLVHVDSSEEGWLMLYRDISDYRLWELSYPDSHLHGGGAPTLTNISIEEAKSRYKNFK